MPTVSSTHCVCFLLFYLLIVNAPPLVVFYLLIVNSDLYNEFEEYFQIGPSYYYKRFLQFFFRYGRKHTDSEMDVNLTLLTLFAGTSHNGDAAAHGDCPPESMLPELAQGSFVEFTPILVCSVAATAKLVWLLCPFYQI